MADVKTLNIGGVELRINNGQWEANDGTGWEGMGMVSAVKSMQKGVINLVGAVSTASATIPPVDVAKSVVIFLGASNTNTATGAQSLALTLELTNSTTVTVKRGITGVANDNILVSWEVIEYV